MPCGVSKAYPAARGILGSELQCSTVEHGNHGRLQIGAEVVGSRVRQIRETRGWTANDLASRCKDAGMKALSRSTIAKIEANIRGFVTVDELLILARVFEISPTELLEPVSLASRMNGISPPADRPFVCPYCFSSFSPLPTLYRCIDCNAEALPPRRSRKPFILQEAACSECTGKRMIQFCPDCARDLVRGLEAQEEIIFAMIGPIFSGKTCFTSALVRTFDESVGKQWQCSLSAINDETAGWLSHQSQSFSKGQLPQATRPSMSVGRSHALLFELKASGHGSALTTPGISIITSDEGGESFQSHRHLSEHSKYVGNANCIFIMVEPAALQPSLSLLPGATTMATGAPSQMVSDVANAARRARRLPRSVRVPVPVAILLSKWDIMIGAGLSPESIRWPVTSVAHSLSIRRDLERLLSSLGHDQLLRALDAEFSTYAFFPVVAMGGLAGMQDFDPKRITSLGVIDPLRWVLQREGLIGRNSD